MVKVYKEYKTNKMATKLPDETVNKVRKPENVKYDRLEMCKGKICEGKQPSNRKQTKQTKL